jgi:hypothetical protein
MTGRAAGGARERVSGEGRRPARVCGHRFRGWDGSRMVRRGPQIASCEVGLIGAGPIGVILAGLGRRELARPRLGVWG